VARLPGGTGAPTTLDAREPAVTGGASSDRGVDASPASSGTQPGGERLLSATEVAELLAVPVTWVREATRAGLLPHVRLGRYARYERDQVLDWVTQQRSGRARTSSPRPTEAARR
jgi:excisionase family DNA binding protein